MQSIVLCLGDRKKILEQKREAIEKIRNCYRSMSHIKIQFGEISISARLHSLTMREESNGRYYLECHFDSLEEYG